MIFYYLDASAWVKRYYWETGTTWVQSLFARGSTVACASLGLVEVMATLARKAKAREIGRRVLAGKVRELEEDRGGASSRSISPLKPLTARKTWLRSKP